jgi:predicted YcjX-like family ATPase
MLVDLLSDAALAELTAQCDEAARRMEQRSLTDPTKAANAIRITIRYRRIASWLRWRTSR